MSYDFLLFTLPPGSNIDEVFDNADINGWPSNGLSAGDQREQNWAVARALYQKMPDFDVFPQQVGQFLAQDEFPFESARLLDRIELNAPGENPIEVALYLDHASVKIRYWYTGEIARRFFEEARNYLAIIRAQTGYIIHDGQLDKVIDLSTDFDAIVDIYVGVVRRFRTEHPNLTDNSDM